MKAQKTEMQGTHYHEPVMLKECIEALSIKPDGIYVDCTFGGGGHSRAILDNLSPQGRLYAFDQDSNAIANAIADDRLVMVPYNFRHLQRFLRLYQVEKVNGLLADLGVSSHQLDEASRGFSYRFEAPLDMRMDTRQGQTAADLLNSSSVTQLQQILSTYGEVTNAKTLAKAIEAARRIAPFKSISDLLRVLQPLSKGNPQRYFAQVFQALRIAVNEETEALKEMLAQLPDCIAPGGRVVIITFHSLEDRIVKQFFKGEVVEDPVYGATRNQTFEAVYKKPIEPGAEELKRNNRARSARLRVYQRL
jgi:16S rRNA (cytosine1402-N4)-methyltransferase